jgi:tRNA nucleotidyltransferase (CCA-adding enzyme)
MTPDQYMASLDLPEVYRVGGSVRDEELGRRAKDSDYMVRGTGFESIAWALTQSGAKISPLKLRDGGKQIGWRAKVRDIGMLEIVLPRTEISTGPSRHDFEIHLDSDLPLEADAQRRDFTVNALYRNVKTGEIVDPTGSGLDDLRRRVISTIHSETFEEDPLRILRALRFVSVLPDFDLTLGTADQMRAKAEAVTGLTQKGVSGTALEELSKLLMGSNPQRALQYMADQGVMAHFLPELQPMIDFDQRSRHHEKTTSDHVFAAVQHAAQMHNHAPLRVRLALLFHDSGKPTMAWTDENGLQHYYALTPKRAIELGASVNSLEDHETWSARHANDALRRLNAPKQLRKDVLVLIERHMLPTWENIKPFKVRKMRAELGDDLLHDLITHRTCDILAKGDDPPREQLEALAWIANEQQRAKDNNVPVTVNDLKLRGSQIQLIGAKGPQIGEVQRKLLHDVLAQPKLNNEDWLLSRAVHYVTEV